MNAEERIEKLERELGRAKRRRRVLLAGFALLTVAVAGLWAVDTLTTPAEAQQAGNPQTGGATELREEVLGGIERGLGQEPKRVGRQLVNMAAEGDLAAAQLLLAYIDGGFGRTGATTRYRQRVELDRLKSLFR